MTMQSKERWLWWAAGAALTAMTAGLFSAAIVLYV